MKTVVIDGVEYENMESTIRYGNGTVRPLLRPIPKPKKTLVEIFAGEDNVELVRANWPRQIATLDAIEERLHAIEKKLEWK